MRELNVKVIPKSSKSEIAGFLGDGTLKVKVCAAPEKGRANEEVREVLARHFGVAPSQVEIVTGQTNPRKRVRILP